MTDSEHGYVVVIHRDTYDSIVSSIVSKSKAAGVAERLNEEYQTDEYVVERWQGGLGRNL